MRLGCRVDHEELVWLFSALREDSSVSGYFNSIRQRLSLLDAKVPSLARLVSWESSDEEVVLVSEVVVGEPMLQYLNREGSPGQWVYLSMIRDLVGALQKLAVNGRVLSSFGLDDFFVTRRGGGRLEVVPVAATALMREEYPMSNFQLAKRWYETIARLLIAPKSGWGDEFDAINPGHSRPMKKLLRVLASGQEQSLMERFDALDEVIKGLLGMPKLKAQQRTCYLAGAHPKGFLESPLLEGLESEFQENGLGVNGRRCLFSPFVMPTVHEESGERRLTYIVPPEAWFRESHIDAVNRKMAHPFLKNHHNGVRALSVFCGEVRTCLVGEGQAGIPLPVILAAKEGLPPDEFQAIAEKLHRALELFESADLAIELDSPWQIELHPELPMTQKKLSQLLTLPLKEWPTWDVKLRMELPTEHFIASRRTSAWRELASRNMGAFFPLLLAWMLEWKRFDWAERNGMLADEPLTWDEVFAELLSGTGTGAKERLRLLEGIRGLATG